MDARGGAGGDTGRDDGLVAGGGGGVNGGDE